MALENVPTLYNGTANYRTTIALDGVNFILHFLWNGRDEHWYLSVHDGDDTPITGYVSRKLVGNWFVGNRSTDPNRPDGLLFIVSSEHEDPAFLALGVDTLLHYLPSDDLTEFLES
jgi:hypothetical protein